MVILIYLTAAVFMAGWLFPVMQEACDGQMHGCVILFTIVFGLLWPFVLVLWAVEGSKNK